MSIDEGTCLSCPPPPHSDLSPCPVLLFLPPRSALCPQAPFSSVARLRLGAIVLPLVLASLFISSSVVYKGTTFGIGFGMFGQPVIDRMAQSGVREWLDRDYPGWRKALELRK